MVIDITRDELRSFIAQAAVRGDIVPRRFLDNLDLLHPLNIEELLNFVLGCIDFREGIADERRRTSSSLSSSLLSDGMVASASNQKSAAAGGGGAGLMLSEDNDEDSDRDDGFREHCNELRSIGWKPSTHPTDQIRSKVLFVSPLFPRFMHLICVCVRRKSKLLIFITLCYIE
jgi:hypothetical protein